MKLHKLLQRQVAKYLGSDMGQQKTILDFIEAINDSYLAFERDKEIMDHAFKLSEEEYIEVNNNLKLEYELRSLSIEKLKEGLKNIKSNSDENIEFEDTDLLPIVNYLNAEINKRKNAEEDLSRTLKLLTTLLTNLHSGILMEDENRKILFTNQQFCDLFLMPYKPEDLIGFDCSKSVDQSKLLFKDPEKFANKIEELLRCKEKVVNIELEMINGKVLALDYIPIYVGEKYTGHLWDYTDITEHIQAERNLLNITNVQQTILNGTNYSIIYTNESGLIKSYNRGAQAMLGYTADEMIDRHTPAVFHLKKEVEERAKALSKELGRTIDPDFEAFVVNTRDGTVQTGEWTYVRKDGVELKVLLSISSIADQNKKIIGYLGIARDITEQKKAEEALKQSEDRYKEIIEKSSDIIYKSNKAGYFTFVNSVAERITGYSKEELYRKQFIDLIRPDYKHKTSRYYLRQIKKLIPSTYFEFPLITKNNTTIWIGQSVQLSSLDHNDFELVALARDVSARRYAEDEITRSNQRLQLFHSLINNTSDAIQVATEDGQLFYINNEASERLGIDPFFASKYNVKDFELVFKEEGAWENHVKLLKEKNIITLEGENLNQKTGQQYAVEVTVRYININRQGYIIANSRDITTRKSIERLLRTQEEKFRNIISNINLGLMEIDNDGNIQYINQGFTNMSGYTLNEIKGQKPTELFVSGKNKRFAQEKSETRRKGFMDRYELEIRNKRGEHKWWMIAGAPNYNDDGKLTGSIGIYLDITEQKKMELELEKAKTKAESASKAKEVFLANMSHEIRTPLNAISGMIRELSKEDLTEKQKTYINNSSTASKHLLSIINNILDISKIEAGELSLESEHFFPEQSLNNVVSILKTRADEKGIFLKSFISPEISQVLIGDSLRFEQILMNLVGNAIKFTQTGGVTVNCALLKEEKKHQKIEISVIDTGIGMEPEYLNSIFSKFSQEDKSISRKFGGTGLGMAITYELVQLMKGNITVKSDKTNGTTFYIQLHLPKGNEEETRSKTLNHLPAEIEKTRVLLVEDNEMNRIVAQNSLNYFGCITAEAINGIQAIEILKHSTFDIILMDIQMPEMDGIEATKVIRNKLKITTPIIALTANAFKTEIELCKSVGMNDYVTKPFDENILLNTIANNLNKTNRMNFSDTNRTANDSNELLYDLSNLISMSRGNHEFVQKMTALFIQQSEQSVQQILESADQGNFKEVSRIAHKIKPSIDNMGIKSLSERIRLLEQLAHLEEDADKIHELVNEVATVLKKVNQQLMSIENSETHLNK